MDRTLLLERIALAEENVAVGERSIFNQRQIVKELKRGGHDSAAAQDLLEQYLDIQLLHVADLERLREELAALSK